jgi:ATP-dependent Clp protease ATP-binding subunit ClpA
VISELHGFFRPELIGRFDEKIVFRPLSPDTQREIAGLP